jgi:hypothetical protein
LIGNLSQGIWMLRPHATKKKASSFNLDFLDDLGGHKIEIVFKRLQRERNKF